ncbi:STAS/SEC14 domain-containing protein [Polyangium sorediatum]|uniref:STAS/SEC14 domain-containing protein n=1 Tax=Polyangium sorediatum TaxID=889274 RepID=A0ABT6NXV3_9BACT|nr:STAS/SEC14 domain-containing protein [Polyangium sorediatum]MDI1432890.1 STAS/SEC14 domain-containing protein [Polyangium sorediatum]
MSPDSPPTVLRFGDHCVRFVAPDLVIAEFKTFTNTEDVVALTDVLRAAKKREGQLFTLVDLSGVTTVPQRVRMTGARIVPDYDALAFVGAGFGLRVITEMVMRATKALSPKLSFPYAFFDDHAAALAWLQTHRRAREATTEATDLR